ncbi:AAA family ATPase [Pantoea ananatis]|uniref:AAA family ATPase n=1 Tax=Pantoea ananas TaxID=553 RepID=UPI003FA4AB69
MIKEIKIVNYRSIRDITLSLGELNVVFGPNGCGKSNLYKAIELLSSTASGQMAKVLSEDGGLENVMWSGKINQKNSPRRLKLSCETDNFEYEIQVGFPLQLPNPTHFELDPIIKEESIWTSGFNRRPSSLILNRKNQNITVSNLKGDKVIHTGSIYENESFFSQLSEPHLYPEVSLVREAMRKWRFYHEFDVTKKSVIRQPQVGFRSPVLTCDGLNLAAAYQTIVEIGNVELLNEILDLAFPGCIFYCLNDKSRFHMMMQRDGILRPFEISEFSDGTIRFLCLAVALLSPRPPSLIVLNEPENSLHPQLYPALAKLIAEANDYSQIWLTSHSTQLAELISSYKNFKFYELSIQNGQTHAEEK